MSDVRREMRIRQRLIRRIVRAHRDAITLGLQPVVCGLHLILLVTEKADADRTPNPGI